MNIDRFKYFIEVANSGSITQAAKKCNISQTAMTQQMNEMERELDAHLLNRTKGGTVLTPTGEYILPKIQKLVREYDDILFSVKPNHDNKITVAYTGPLEQNLLLRAIPKFHTMCPKVSIELRQYSMAEMSEALEHRKCDIALTIPEEININNYFHVIVAERPIMLAVSKKNRLASKKAVCIKDIINESMIVLNEDASAKASETINFWCIQMGWNIEKILYADTIENQLLMVALNQGITLVPYDLYQNNICLVKLKDDMQMHKTEAVFIRTSKQINQMVECLKNAY